jgi:hypothetical protein
MWRWLFIFLLCGLCLGCQHRGEYAVKNAGMTALTDVIVSTDSGHWHMPGILIPKATSGFSGDMPMKPMNIFTISWVDDTGKKHRAQIDASRVELQDSRVIMFVIDDTAAIKKTWFHRERSF